jgi:cytochrome b561
MNVSVGIENFANDNRRARRFDRTSMLLHWLTVLLIASQLATAWSMDGKSAPGWLIAHRSLGLVTWFVVVGRLLWRHRFAYLPPFPLSMPLFQQLLAKLNEHALYALLLMQPLTGTASTLLRGRSFILFVWRVPAIMPENKTLFHAFNSLHESGAWALMSLIAIHAAAALFHGLVLKDGVLRRMLP